MTRKGGGRESGGYPASGEVRTASGGNIVSAAANPVAPHMHPEGCLCELHQAWRRIRALEAENQILTDAMQKEIAKVRALEAELAALEKGAVEGSWRARAEKVEARVKEFKDVIREVLGESGDFPGLPDDWPGRPFYWREWLRRKLRGEDRG